MSIFLRAQNLSKQYKLEAGLFAGSGRKVNALNGVDFTVKSGETYGLVGESGSGKTTLARLLVQLETQSSGSIEFMAESENPWIVSTKDRKKLVEYRQQVKYIFQDPSSSLDPRMSVGRIITVGAQQLKKELGKAGLRDRAGQALMEVGLNPRDLERRPSEFSGGQRQRISIARALISRPAALVCDEIVSALDVSVQSQILNLLLELKRRHELTIFFIAHDLAVVSYISDRVGVMYGGRLMEEAPARELGLEPLHPYTRLLYQSAHATDTVSSVSKGANFDPTKPLQGCPFAPRCPLADARCVNETPAFRTVAENRKIACHHVLPE